MSETAEILVVEDNENLRMALVDNLEAEGYRAAGVATGAEARRAFNRHYDLVVLDVMLPDADGYRLCEELRAEDRDTMVLMLTARTLEDDMVRGFDAGADDYLPKPYRLRELLARVSALLRRGGRAPAPDRICFGDFAFDRRARRVVDVAGHPVELTRKELLVLELFLTNLDRAFTRDEILDRVWGEDVVVDTRTVDNFVSSLKKKLRWREGAAFAIRTIRGIGYRMELTPPERLR